MLLNNTNFPDSKVHGASMGPTWGRQDPGGPHVGPINFAIWVTTLHCIELTHLIQTIIAYLTVTPLYSHVAIPF